MANRSLVNLTISPTDKLKIERTLLGIKDGAPRAMTRALNEMAAKAKTAISREIRANIDLKGGQVSPVAYVNERLKVRKATFTEQSANVSAPRRGLLLSYFLRKNQATFKLDQHDNQIIEVRIKPKGRYERVTGKPGGGAPFFLPLRRGVETGQVFGIFQRVNGKLVHLYGPSLSQVFNIEKDELLPEFARDLAAQLDREVAGVLAQYG